MIKFIKLFLVVLLLASCSKKDNEAADYNMIISTSQGDVTYAVENAQTIDELQKGLMFRDSLAPDTGMIFDLSKVQNVAMWMKNTKIPLDMIFIDSDGSISWIYENAQPLSEDYIIPPMAPYAVVEINAGDIQKHGIKVGDIVKHKFLNNFDNKETQPQEKAVENKDEENKTEAAAPTETAAPEGMPQE